MARHPKSFPSDVKPVQSIATTLYGAATTQNGTGVDTRGFSHAMLFIPTSAIAAGGTTAITLQDSADNSTFADITGCSFSIVVADADSFLCAHVTLDGKARYVRAKGVTTVNSVSYGAFLLLYGAETDAAQSVAYEFDVA